MEESARRRRRTPCRRRRAVLRRGGTRTGSGVGGPSVKCHENSPSSDTRNFPPNESRAGSLTPAAHGHCWFGRRPKAPRMPSRPATALVRPGVHAPPTARASTVVARETSRCRHPPPSVGGSDEQLVVEFLDGRHQLRHLLRGRLLLRWRRDCAARGGLARRQDQVLDAAGDQDEQQPAAGVADCEAMRDVTGPEGVVARAGLDGCTRDPERDVALEDPDPSSSL